MFDAKAKWVWSGKADREYNNFVCFRRTFNVSGDAKSINSAKLLITADSRYEVFVNGEWLGHGPVRSWPSPWPVDSYDLRGVLRPGRNVVTVTAQHFGTGTFQYLACKPGLIAQLDWRDSRGSRRIVTDGSWRAIATDAYAWPVSRISCMLAWEEQFDARKLPPNWQTADFDDAAWPAAKVLRPAGKGEHDKFEPRDIPMLTREPVQPVRVCETEIVNPCDYIWSINPHDLLKPDDLTANPVWGRLLLATYIYSDKSQEIQFQLPHNRPARQWQLNGKPLAFSDKSLQDTDGGIAHAKLKAGWNTLMGRLPEMEHYWWAVINIWTQRPVKFSSQSERVKKSPTPWLYVGPFATAGDAPPWNNTFDDEFVSHKKYSPGATAERCEQIWDRGELAAADLTEKFVAPLAKYMVADADVYAACVSERAVVGAQPKIDEPTALLQDNSNWTTIHPSKDGDVRFLLDFGREVVGFHEIELDAPAGTLVDSYSFEFIQRDGRKNLTEGLNNSFRYVCREGRQHYRTWNRRGFRYSWVTLRNFRRAVRVRMVRTLMSTYPVDQAGDFACSDRLLEQIWQVGAHSVRCCAEDTYTDCPSYEQAFWVGDARNEALVDLVSNGDSRLSRRCWMLAGKSLDRSPIVESQVPSAWRNVLPAWSFLWMRWAQEHYMLTGDKAFAREAMKYLRRNASGIVEHLNDAGLFEIQAWNMFDWAAMDTPHDGVITHLNCLAVLGLRQTADFARLLGQKTVAKKWDDLAASISRAVNKHMWCDRRKAYVDCIRADGSRSTVFSQQTQTAAYISGVAAGERSKRCRAIIEKAPKGFVTAGSPFFMFFLLEALAGEGNYDELTNTIRDYWGPQIHQGATTFWEAYHPQAERKTRSHCHGWSAAPTFFLTQYILGVTPAEPGYATVRIAPQPGKLKWAQGRVPTPRGIVECYWQREGNVFTLDITLPPNTPCEIELPFAGTVAVEKGSAQKVSRRSGKPLCLLSKSRQLRITVQSYNEPRL